MEDARAKEIVQQWSRLDSESANTMSLYQQVADHFFVRENSITSTKTPGEDKSLSIYDPTGQLDLQYMVSGLYASIMPNGQYFYRLSSSDPGVADIPHVAGYLNRLTELGHNEMLKGNLPSELSEWLYSLAGFGTGNIFSGWDSENLTLYFKDWDVANYRFWTDFKGYPAGVIIKWNYTAQQAYEEFGEDAGRQVVECAKDVNKSYEKFSFLWRVQKRKNRDAGKSDNLNMPWEEVVVNEKEKTVVKETGYRRFPYHIARWTLSSQEIWGRGQGTVALSADKDLQQQWKSLLTCANLNNFPPYEVPWSFDGTPRITPGAMNRVLELGSIKPLDRAMYGNFPVTQETIAMQHEIIHDCFFKKIFAPLDDLTGDRRTQIEIMERIKSGYIRLINPITRIYAEGLSKLIENCTLLLIENHMIEPPPAELQKVRIDYLGRLALALQEQQVDAFQRFSEFAVQMEAVVPGFFRKTINIGRASRRMASVYGMNEGDLNTPEEQLNIEQQEQQQRAAEQAMLAAESAGKAYKDASVAPQPGSPAEALVAAEV